MTDTVSAKGENLGAWLFGKQTFDDCLRYDYGSGTRRTYPKGTPLERAFALQSLNQIENCLTAVRNCQFLDKDRESSILDSDRELSILKAGVRIVNPCSRSRIVKFLKPE